MAFFGSLKNSLKQKWLQYFQSNRSWISLHSSVATPDGGKRPPSYLILGVINALEPQLQEWMLPFSKLNLNVDTLIDVLSLNAGARTLIGLSRFHWLPSISQKYSGWTRSGRTFTTEA